MKILYKNGKTIEVKVGSGSEISRLESQLMKIALKKESPPSILFVQNSDGITEYIKFEEITHILYDDDKLKSEGNE